MSIDSSSQDIQAAITDALARLREAEGSKDVEQVRIDYLGKKGAITQQLKAIGSQPPPLRQQLGRALNDAKTLLKNQIALRAEEVRLIEQEVQLSAGGVDISLGGRRVNRGGLHPITRTLRRIHSIFQSLGFDVAEGPEIEDEYHNFEALNIPPDHPARDMHDTFYVERGTVLRTHTSPVQIRYLKANAPPVQVIAPGRVFRCDSDVTHTPMFHQLEGLVVDENTTFSHLKGTLTYFVHEFFEQELPIRFRPSYFPFTEPSAEVDMGCVLCNGAGCRVCGHTGWLEILGCGMVHPEVFRHVELDTEKYSGYAFGMGIERLTMLRYSVNDLRLFFENELSFLGQFR